MRKIRINMLSQATIKEAQGVGSVYIEQLALLREKDDDIFEIYENSNSKNFDIYHIHTVNPQYFNRINNHHINIAFVHFIPETLEGTLNIPRLSEKAFYRYVNRFYKRVDELVVVNPMYKKQLMELGIKEDSITFIPNFVSKKSFYRLDKSKISEIRKEFGIPEDKFVVAACGQCHQQKGVVDFIKTAEKCPDIYFIWLGGFVFGKTTGGYKEVKEAIDNAPSNCKFLGIIKRERINDLYNAADVFFSPSFQEFFPMSILEACSSGKPLILRDLDCYKYIFPEHYLTGNNVDEFASQINALKENLDLFKKYEELSFKISNDYSEESVNEIWREYYQRIYNKYLNDSSKKLVPLDEELKNIKK